MLNYINYIVILLFSEEHLIVSDKLLSKPDGYGEGHNHFINPAHYVFQDRNEEMAVSLGQGPLWQAFVSTDESIRCLSDDRAKG